jgi:hypothetical protein
MSTKRRLKRFSDNTYFRNLGFETLGDMAVGIASSGLKIFLRYCVFGGLLGSFWVIAMLEPQGPLLLYILPLIALGFPLCLISEYRTGWTLFFSILLLMIIGSITVGYLYNVYQEATATGQTIPHIAVGIIGFIVCFLIIFIYKKRHEENSGGGIRISWFIGVLVYLSISGVIFYLYFVRRQPIESSAAILLCVVAFAICLALVLIRVYWLDAMQAFKAMRLSDVPLDNIFLLLELLMPRSMFIFVIMPSLLVSEAMLFAIIHYTTQNTSITQNTPVIVTNQAEPRKPSLNLDNQDGKLKLPRKLAHPENQERRTGLENKEPRSRNTLKNREKLPHPHHGGDVRGSEPVKKNSGVSSTCEIAPRAPPATTSPENYRIFSWLWFTIAPYVFPKNADGTEIQAPYWIKPFGRLLLSIMFLLILTYHLNIWSQFRSCYYKLIDLVRHNAHLPTADLSLREQWLDAQKEVRYRLDYYSNIWRRLILYASVAPFNSLVWKIILHPGRAFWEGLYQLYRYCIFSWPQTALFGFAFLLVITSPIALWVGEFEPLMYCVGPLLGVAVILAILRKWWNVHPPRILSMAFKMCIILVYMSYFTVSYLLSRSSRCCIFL